CEVPELGELEDSSSQKPKIREKVVRVSLEEECMRRRAARKRRPTAEDLTESQRAIYEVLPEDLKEEYLKQLPAIETSPVAARKKAQLIEERIQVLDNALRSLQANKKHLEQLQKSLKQGGNPAAVDLRQELK